MEAFAKLSDYEARYGAPADPARASVLLEDASALLASHYETTFGEPYEVGAHAQFDRSAAAVACLLVNRVLSAPSSMSGATQYSQGAGGYTASVTFGNGLGEMYLGKSDLKRLGLDVQVLRSLSPMERGAE